MLREEERAVDAFLRTCRTYSESEHVEQVHSEWGTIVSELAKVMKCGGLRDVSRVCSDFDGLTV